MSVLRRYNPLHFVLEGQQLNLTSDVLNILAGSSFTTALSVTIAAAASPTINVLETLTARRGVSTLAGFGAALLFKLDDSANVAQEAAQIAGVWESPTAGAVSGALVFHTVQSSGVLTEHMRLTASGQLLLDTSGAPHASAQFQVNSTTKGMLPPRWTTTQKNAISSPSAGLFGYDSTVNAFYGYNGSAWLPFGNLTLDSNSEVAIASPGAIGAPGLGMRYDMGVYAFTQGGAPRPILIWDYSTGNGAIQLGNLEDNTTLSHATAARVDGGGHFWFAGSATEVAALDDVRQSYRVPLTIYIGSAPSDPASSTAFEINSSTSGYLQPRWTTTQRNAIGSPTEGLLGYDSTLHRTMERRSAAWARVGDNSLLVGDSGQAAEYLGGTTVTDVETIVGNVIASVTKTLHFVDCTADRTISLPAAALVGSIHIFIDYLRQASVHPTTFNVESSGTIDGNSTAVISDTRYARTFIKLTSSTWMLWG